MTDASEILKAIAANDYRSVDKLLPIVYEELRRLARKQLAQERPGQTFGATALVHEAYLRLIGEQEPMAWTNRGHFFAAAAEAMRRILIENARARQRQKRGGDFQRREYAEDLAAVSDVGAVSCVGDRLLELDEALRRLEQRDDRKAQLVKLRFFAGLTNEEAAQALGVSAATAARDWAFARAWLKREMSTG